MLQGLVQRDESTDPAVLLYLLGETLNDEVSDLSANRFIEVSIATWKMKSRAAKIPISAGTCVAPA